MTKSRWHCRASHFLQKTKSSVKDWKYFPNGLYRERRRFNSPALEKWRWRAVVDEAEAFRTLLYTSSDHYWDVSHALCKSFLPVAKLCFAVWIISLIVLIVLVSDHDFILHFKSCYKHYAPRIILFYTPILTESSSSWYCPWSSLELKLGWA